MTATPARHTLDLAARAMRGTVLRPGARGGGFAGAAADSRKVEAGQIFFALPGERTDGFAFCAQASALGAVAVVVARDRGLPAGCDDLAVIAVDDPRAALADLARAVRAAFRGKVVGVTGSNGKTTTKELVAAALRPLGEVLRTPGNLNTDVGLPLTVLSARGNEAAWVLEMAMRGRGEIALLADIARPDVGIITNVSGAHLERLGSIEEVARAKGELYAGLGPDGVAVLPADEPQIEAQADAARIPPARRLAFGGAGRGDVRVLDVIPAGTAGSVVRYAVCGTPVVVRLPLGGAHNARNGAAALAAAFAAGVAPLAAAQALETLTLPPHRSAAVPAGGRTIFDDCYNANPASMRAALAAVIASAGAAGRAYAVLGDMLELGPTTEALHREVGREAGARLAGVVAVGAAGAAALVEGARAAGLPPTRALVAPSPEEAAALVAGWTAPGDWILVKASRGIQLERAVAALVRGLDQLAGGAGPAPGAAAV